MPIIGTMGSGYYLPPDYSLALTATTTQNYTIPEGYTKMGAVLIAGGGGGGAGGYSGWGMGGGGAGAAVAFHDYAVVPGQNYSLVVGSGGNGGPGGYNTTNNTARGNDGGASSIAGIANANGGLGPTWGGFPDAQTQPYGSGGTYSVNGAVTESSYLNGKDGRAVRAGGLYNDNWGNDSSVVFNGKTIPDSYQRGGGGGTASSSGSAGFVNGAITPGVQGGTPHGGTGGNTGYRNSNSNSANGNAGGAASGANGRGGGGGGGGRGGNQGNNGSPGIGGAGGSGGAGIIYIYLK
jgi:hypothetical protein